MNTNIVWHQATVTRERREEMNRHRGTILWFTGLSGAGKSTLAHATEERLHQMGVRTFVFDGDNVRHGLCKDLGFSDDDRTENIRRIGEVAKLCLNAGLITMTAFISPFRKDRREVREMAAEADFHEIFCHASLEVCEARDVKGLYKKARAGEIPEFTGISSPYEEPEQAELLVETGTRSVDECVDQVITYLRGHGVIPQGDSMDDAGADADQASGARAL